MNNKLKIAVLLVTIFAVSCSLSKRFRTVALHHAKPHYVVVGCSAAGYFAAKELVKLGQGGKVTCISEENTHPYNKTQFHAYVAKKDQRPSKIELGKGNLQQIEFMLGVKVVAINRETKTIHLKDQTSLKYDKLLIATGARPQVPNHLSAHVPSPRIRFYDSKEDLETILSAVDKNPTLHIAIVGAGIRALELSDGLKRRHKNSKVSILNRSRQFFGEHGDARSDEFIATRLKAQGVNFIAPAAITNISEQKQKLTLTYEQGLLEADFVVFCMGTTPNSELAKTAQLELNPDASIVVDSELKTSNRDIYAAGDVAGFKNPLGAGSVRSAKWRSAKQQGQIAAANMVGQHRVYHHEPAAFVTSFFGMKAVLSGDVRSKPLTSSAIKSEEKRYFRYVLEQDRLQSFITVWDKGARRPNIFLLRRKLIQQSPVSAAELIQ